MKALTTMLLLVVPALCGCSSSDEQSAAPDLELIIGGHFGSAPGEFKSPNGIATDAAGNVYVVDMDNHRIQKFSNTGQFLTEWGSEGTGSGQFMYPGRIAVDRDGFVYVTEVNGPGNGVTRIQKFTGTGAHVSTLGSFGSGMGQFRDPVGIAAGSSGRLYVADMSNHRIQVITNTGQFVRAWGDSGTGPGQFQYALEIAVDADENVFVLDVGPLNVSARIQKFSRDGVFLLEFGSQGGGLGEFGEPKGLACDAAGNLYVTDGGASRVLKFTNDGVFITQWGTFGFDPGQLNWPFGVATCGNRDIFVLEPFNYRVSKFRYPSRLHRLATAPEQ